MLESPTALLSNGAITKSTLLRNNIDHVAGADYYVLAIANVLSVGDDVGNPSPARRKSTSQAIPPSTVSRCRLDERASPWGGEKLVLHKLFLHPDLASPPCEGG